jgi:hypothetical protein
VWGWKTRQISRQIQVCTSPASRCSHRCHPESCWWWLERWHNGPRFRHRTNGPAIESQKSCDQDHSSNTCELQKDAFTVRLPSSDNFGSMNINCHSRKHDICNMRRLLFWFDVLAAVTIKTTIFWLWCCVVQ